MRREHYDPASVPGRFLAGDSVVHELVVRWVAQTLAYPGYRALREEWGDIHQEVLHRLVASLREGRFDASLDFRVYVQGIARNTAREQIARQVRDLRRDTAVAAELRVMEMAEEQFLADELVERAVEGASQECRLLFRSVFYEQQSYAQIAADRGIPVGTVKSRLFRCLQQARTRLMEARCATQGPSTRTTSRSRTELDDRSGDE